MRLDDAPAEGRLYRSLFVKATDAKDYVSRIDPHVVLIEGPELARYMVDFDLGVTTKDTYVVKRIDSDFFSDE